MIRSMTAYASVAGRREDCGWTWEMRGVNGRGLDLRLRAPDWIEGLEARVRSLIQDRLARGNVTVTLRVERDAGSGPFDSAAIESALDRIAAIEAIAAARGKVLAPCRATDILAMQAQAGAAKEADPALMAAIVVDLETRLLPSFVEMREAEGRALHAVLNEQLDATGALVARAAGEAEGRRERVVRQMREAHDRITATSDMIDPDRLTQELAVIGMKTDVTEELDRLHAHVDAARGLLDADAPVGRKLDFLMQEFNREANTLASKSQDTALTSTALDLKTVIERMREQVQNVE